MVTNKPSANNRSSLRCAYCNFWEGDCGLKLKSQSSVEFDGNAKGKCIKTSMTKNAMSIVCSRFEFSPHASRYIK